ncbi:MAG: hypothetical protein KIT62_02185 [Cyclobacteriaceae bacterium]|nr:hypothetical protein [Cyclobacteriaceae bacterium]
MKKIPEARTLQEGFDWGTSFVVRGLNLPCNLDTCEARARQKDMELFGYGKGGAELWIWASKAFKQFREEALTLNIVDAPFPVLQDEELPEVLGNAVKKTRKKICLTLTRNGSYTPLHVDPNHGGGWMYLQQGIKKWQLVDASRNPLVPDNAGNYTDPPLDLDATWLSETTIHPGDFLYFPPLTPHRVWTYAHSFGVSGYAKI